MGKDITTKNMNHLNKLLSSSLPKNKKARNLFIIFLLISILGLIGVFVSAFFVNESHWKDVLLSISSGLFASGLFATAVEWMNIRNKKTFIKMKLSELRYYCDIYVDFVSDELFDVEESHTYFEWIDLLIDENKKKRGVFFGLLSRLDDIIMCVSFFFSKEFDKYNNPYIKEGLFFSLRRLSIVCNTAKKIIASEDSDAGSIRSYLKKSIPSAIVAVFTDFCDNFNKKTSYEKN